MYMSNDTYYKVGMYLQVCKSVLCAPFLSHLPLCLFAGNLDSRLTNPDQVLTTDVAHFCAHLSHLYSSLSKPMLDVLLMSYQLFVAMPRGNGQEKSRVTLWMAAVVIGVTFAVLQVGRCRG
jgi:ABC-type uncharacterized transport system fused permease/ATPase subunit